MGRKTHQGRCLIATLLPVLAVPAFAQDIPETEEAGDTIVVVGARIPVPRSEVTAAVTVLDAADIDRHGGVFAVDALRAVPGFTVSRSGPAGSLTDIRARGSEANHVLVLIDGVEAGNPFTGGYDFAQASGFGVENIEVLRGEQSALWGPDAIGGVINIRTIGQSGENRLDLLAEAGSLSSGRAGLALSGARGAASGGGALSLYSTGGIDASGTGGAEDGYDLATVSGTGRADLSPTFALSASIRATRYEGEFDSDTDFDGRLDDTPMVREGNQTAARLAAVFEPEGVGIDWRHELVLSRLGDEAETRNAGVFADRSEGRRWQAYVQSTARWTAVRADHRLTGLIERETEHYVSDGGPGAGQNQAREITTDAVALDYGMTAGPLSLHLSARLDDNDRFENATTWRGGAAWDFPALNGRLRGGIGQGVKNPGVFELFGFFPASFVGNPELRPESSQGWDIGWEQDFEAGHVAITWFQSELDDEIYSDFGSFPATARNRVSLSNRSGLEIEGAWSPAPGVSVRGSAAFLESDENGVPEIRRPERTASLSVSWDPATRPISLSFAADHVGDRLDTDFGSFQTVTLGAYTLVSGRAAWRFDNGVQLYLRGENLMDESHEDVFGYASPGRGLSLGLRYQR